MCKVKNVTSKVAFKPIILQLTIETAADLEKFKVLAEEARDCQLVSGGTRCSEADEEFLNDFLSAIGGVL